MAKSKNPGANRGFCTGGGTGILLMSWPCDRRNFSAISWVIAGLEPVCTLPGHLSVDEEKIDVLVLEGRVEK